MRRGHPTVFTHNGDRLVEAKVAREFLATLLALPQVNKPPSSEHYSIDGTLIGRTFVQGAVVMATRQEVHRCRSRRMGHMKDQLPVSNRSRMVRPQVRADVQQPHLWREPRGA